MKQISIVLLFALMLSIVSCGEQPEIETSSITEDAFSAESVIESQGADQSTESTEEVVYDNWSGISGTSIYVNYRDGRRRDAKKTSVVFHSNHTDMVALHYNKVDAFAGDLDDVFDFLNDGAVISDIASYAYSEANFLDTSKTYEIAVVSKKPVSIGDLDTIEIKGTVVDANGRNCHVYGYTFVLEGIPCFLVGFVFSEAQEAELISAINAEVDAMIQTVRVED